MDRFIYLLCRSYGFRSNSLLTPSYRVPAGVAPGNSCSRVRSSYPTTGPPDKEKGGLLVDHATARLVIPLLAVWCRLTPWKRRTSASQFRV